MFTVGETRPNCDANEQQEDARGTRQIRRGRLNNETPEQRTYGLKSWRYAAAKHWNTLPRDIRSMAGSKDFLKNIRQTDFHVNTR